MGYGFTFLVPFWRPTLGLSARIRQRALAAARRSSDQPLAALAEVPAINIPRFSLLISIGINLAVIQNQNVQQSAPSPALNDPGVGTFSAFSQADRPSTTLTYNSVSSLVYPADLPKYYFSMSISDYERRALMTVVPNVNISGSISLPMPLTMIDAQNITYNPQAISTFLGSIGSVISSGSAVLNHALEGSGLSIASDFGGAGVGAQAFSGQAPNDFLTVILQGPTYKQHTFNWRMSPKTSAESGTLRDIITLLRNSAAPVNNTSMFGYPKVFQISFWPNSEMLYKFKPAVLEDIQVNFAPNGQAAFYGSSGGPESIEMTLHFLELEFWFAGAFS